MSTTWGFITRTEPRATRFFCPPESWNGGRSARSSSSRSASAWATRPVVVGSSRPIWRQPKASSSRTVVENSWTSELWSTIPIRDLKAALVAASSKESSVIACPKAV